MCQNCKQKPAYALTQIITAEGHIIYVCEKCRDYLCNVAHAFIIK